MASNISEAYLSQLSAFIAARMGLHFPRERWRDLEKGINGAARELNFKDVESCIEWLLTSSVERSQIEILAGHLTIGETYFFRDRKIFDVLEKRVLPELIRSRRENGRSLRIWSAGCATGEEPYSIAILLSRMIPDIQDWNITILATDINTRFLKKAAEGLYRHWSFRDTPPGVKERFFEQMGDDRFEILLRVRQMVTFSYLNLAEDTYPSLANSTNAMDIIFCRNVLMYFVPELARKVVQSLYRSTIKGGYLITSPSESSQLLFSDLEAVRYPGAILFRKEAHPSSAASPFSCNLQKKSKAPMTLDAGRSSARPEARSTPPQPKARKAQAEIRKPQPASWDDLYREALTLFERGCYEEAVERAGDLLSKNPSDAEGLALMARIHANRGKLEDALGWCERAIAAEKLNARLHYLLATILQELGRTDGAVASLKKALFLDPSFVMAYVTLGNISRRHGRYAESAKCFENGLSLLSARAPEDILPESEGMNAGRLIEIIRSMQQVEGRESI